LEEYSQDRKAEEDIKVIVVEEYGPSGNGTVDQVGTEMIDANTDTSKRVSTPFNALQFVDIVSIFKLRLHRINKNRFNNNILMLVHKLSILR